MTAKLLTKVIILMLLGLFKCGEDWDKFDVINKVLKYDFSKTPGINMVLVNNDDSILYTTLEGDENEISGTVTLLLKKTLEDLKKTDGCWVGLGFGSSTMTNLDMITFHFHNANEEKSNVGDGWTTGYQPLKLDQNYPDPVDPSLNNIKSFSFSKHRSTNNSACFNIALKWTFARDLTKLDKYDWQEFKKWKNEENLIIGANGYNSASTGSPQMHSYIPKATRLRNGQGIESTITDQKNGNTANLDFAEKAKNLVDNILNGYCSYLKIGFLSFMFTLLL